MSATQYKPEPTGSTQPERQSSLLRTSAAAKALGLGVAIHDLETSTSVSGRCYRCFAALNARGDAEFPSVFCSQECEQEFVNDALGSLTLEDCIRIQARLDALLHPRVDGK